MKSVKVINMFFCLTVMLFLFLYSSAYAMSAKNNHIPPPTNQEVISEVERFTGLGTDVSDLLKKEPALFENIDKQIYYIKIIDNIYNAKDWDAIMVVVDAVVNDRIDKLMAKMFSKTLNTYITIAKAAKASMEIFRDYALVPYLDDSVYEVYKSKRSDAGAYNPREAFDETLAHYGPANYFALKDKKTQALIKSMGYNTDLVSDEMYKKLILPKLETFWFNQLETRYQQEEFEKEYPALKKQADENLKSLMEKVKSLAVKPVEFKWEDLLILPEDLSSNAYFVPKTFIGTDGVSYPFDLCEGGAIYGEDLKGWRLLNISTTHINIFSQIFAFTNVSPDILANAKTWPGSGWTQVDVFCCVQRVADYRKEGRENKERPSPTIINKKNFNGFDGWGYPYEMKNNIIYKGFIIGVFACAWDRNTSEYKEEVSKNAETFFIEKLVQKIDKLK